MGRFIFEFPQVTYPHERSTEMEAFGFVETYSPRMKIWMIFFSSISNIDRGASIPPKQQKISSFQVLDQLFCRIVSPIIAIIPP
jgi:hypothetical protein